MRVLLAFDKFKDALSALDACAVAAKALPPALVIDECPLTDGGEGFAEILTRAVGGEFVDLPVQGPRGDSVNARMGLADARRIPEAARQMIGLGAGNAQKVAIIEMAMASGLALLSNADRDPWLTSTAGTGELMRAAYERGADAILLGVGGSATHDIGAGALAVLGILPLDGQGAPVMPPTPSRWHEVVAFRGRVAAGFPPIKIACDVSNPLLGADGAAAVYAPQKGLQPDDYKRLEGATDRVSALLCESLGQPLSLREISGTGAAGGIPFGLICGAGAQLLSGFDLVSAWFDLDARIAAADVVITGEGRFDRSSLQGKGPGAVVRRALELGKLAHVFAGAVAVDAPPAGLVLHQISPADLDLAAAIAATRQNLAATVGESFTS